MRNPADWLAAHQDEEGGWTARGWPLRCQGACRLDAWTGSPDDDLARTALALLALGNWGHTHRVGTRKRQVRRGLSWLQARCDADGRFLGGRRLLRDQALGALALGEAYALTRDRALRNPVRFAMERLVAMVEGVPLGPEEAGWVGQALRCLRTADLDVRVPRLVVPGVDPGSLATLAWLGSRGDPAVQTGVARLLGAPAPPDPEATLMTAFALERAGRGPGHEWIRARQAELAVARGSGPCSDQSWAPDARHDRVQATALAAVLLSMCRGYERAGE